MRGLAQKIMKMGHSLMVTVVPVARLKFKLSRAGTVKPLSVISVHLTASATSVDVKCIRCNTNNSLDIPDKELMVAEQAAFTKVAPENNNNKKTRNIVELELINLLLTT